MPEGHRRDAIHYSRRLEWPVVRPGPLKKMKLTKAASKLPGAGP